MASVVARSAERWPRASAEPSEQSTLSTSLAFDRNVDRNSAAAIADDLSREVYCILGMPIDAIDMPAVVQRIETAAANAIPFIISTLDINFLVNSQKDPEFSEPLLLSDLCPPDGMPIVWIARLMGLPIKQRIAGPDIFEALKAARLRPDGPLKVFFFATKERVTAQAARTLSAAPELSCVAWISPGWRGWKRYFHDGSLLLYLMLTRVLPVAISAQWLRRKYQRGRHDLIIEQVHGSDSVTLRLSGFALASHMDEVISCFREAVATEKQIVIDFSETCAVDTRFLGLLLMLRKQLTARNSVLRFMGISRRLERMFRLNGLGYLLPAHVEEKTQGRERDHTVYVNILPTGESIVRPKSPLEQERAHLEQRIREFDRYYDDGSGQSPVGRRLPRQKTDEKQQTKNH
jgi:anti-anti-sigma regulatory factor